MTAVIASLPAAAISIMPFPIWIFIVVWSGGGVSDDAFP
jgi:hypothetical protein